MKQKDLLMIGAVCLVSIVVAVITSRLIFSKPADRKQTAEIVQPIKADFPAPDERYFNSKAFNPTQLIEIGVNNNTDPFKNPVR